MSSKTFSSGEKGISIQHKITGQVYDSDGCDFFSYDSDKFDELSGGNICTEAQRNRLRILMELHGKNIVDLLDKYKKKTLKDFSYQDLEKLISYLD